MFDQAMSRRRPSFAIQWFTWRFGKSRAVGRANTASTAARSSGGASDHNGRSSISSRSYPVAFSHATFQRRIRPSRSSTMTSAPTVSMTICARSWSSTGNGAPSTRTRSRR